MSDSKLDLSKTFELLYMKFNELVENAYQQLILVSNCKTKDEFERLGYILKVNDSPFAFNKTLSLFFLDGFETKHIMSLEVKADFSDGTYKFVTKPLVNEMEK